MNTRKMKDSGVEWLGAVPEGWKILPSRTLFSEVKQKNDDGNETRQFSFRYGQIVDKDKSGRSDVTTEETITAYRVVTPDTIMINGLNLNYDFISQRVAIVKERGIITSAYLALAPKKDLIEPSYALYLFKGYDSKQVFHGHGSGIRKTLNYSDFAEIKSVLPPLPEQRAIAAYLDKRCAKIDAMVADAKKLIEEYKAWKASVIFEAVTGKVGVDGRCRCRKMRDSGVEWLGYVPESFTAAKFKFVLSRNDGGVWGDDPLLDGNDKVVLRSTEQNIDGSWNITDPALRDLSTISGLSYYLIEEGDLLLTKSSGSDLHIGKTTIADSRVAGMECYYSNFMQRLRVDCDKMLDRFAWYILNSSIARSQFVFQQNATSGIGNINSQHINNIIVPIPPLPEQRAIAAYLDRKCAAIDRVVAEKEGLIADLERYKKSLIFECVTGKREVA